MQHLLLSHRFEKPVINYVGTSCFDRLAIALHFYWITHDLFYLCKYVELLAKSDFVLSGPSAMAFLDPTFWTASCFGLSVLGLRLFGLWPL